MTDLARTAAAELFVELVKGAIVIGCGFAGLALLILILAWKPRG